MRPQKRQLIVIGAGPYGLATAAYARHCGLDTLVLGKPMGFWRTHMPRGMLLRSGPEWHMDPLEVHTLAHYLLRQGIDVQAMGPVPVEVFIDYANWFQDQKGLSVQPDLVSHIAQQDGAIEVKLENGELLLADSVLAVPGLAPFANIPQELAAKLPASRYSHTDQTVSFDSLKGKRCLIIGGRQSAFEWAVLLAEQAGAEVHVVHRHPTPRFVQSDWSWVEDMMRASERLPGWFRRLSPTDQELIRQRFWVEGRLQLEAWLAPRLAKKNIRSWPGSTLVRCELAPNGELCAWLDHGEVLRVDHIILATGYRVDVHRVSYLSAAGLAQKLRVSDGYPILDEGFQSSIPGLFFAGALSSQDFGPFFGFVRGCTVTARILVDRLIQRS